MRIVEDIVRVKRKKRRDLLSNNEAKKIVYYSRFKDKVLAENAENNKRKTISLKNLISFNKRLIFGMAGVLFVFTVFVGLFLYNSDKSIPISVENIAAELEKENELFEKEISELEEFNSGDASIVYYIELIYKSLNS
jgi:hypothetical protein